MKRGTRFAVFAATPLILASFAFFAPAANAQDDSAAAPMVLGDFNLSGSATAGYRFTDVKGYQPQYREMFNLRDGFRLLDLDLFGESQEGKNPFADTFSLQLSGLGGDPFPIGAICDLEEKGVRLPRGLAAKLLFLESE